MFIQTEDTPNPSTVKFLPGRTVYSQGSEEFNNKEDAQRSPLATRLFEIEGIKSILFGADFISVTKTGSYEWFLLKPLILETLVHYLASHSKIEIKPHQESVMPPEDLDNISKEIIELLDSKIRPAVAMDGGDIIFDRFEEGIVYLKMKGACSGCPSSTMTLKSGIENMLRYYVPEVQEVRAIE